MNIRKEFPVNFHVIENVWIPMSDGVNLAARLWIPDQSEMSPVPAIFEYIPYRKRDGTRTRDESNFSWFAGHGYACIRVDMRGSGDSEGVLTDEYLEKEQDDAIDVLEWLGNQSWCNGSVGMIGISWGGFNGLQVAARRPPQLKAVVTVCSTDDRYADDVHYMGGCLLADNLSWASTMFAYNSCPPDPEIVGERWRDMWIKRLEGSGLWIDKWLQHQRRDDYWKHGSICENFEDVQIPVLAASGWADGYTNAVFRLMEKLSGPRMGLVGPWSHRYPNEGVPGPAIGFLQECLRWWDQWLKGKETGVREEPRLRVWMQDTVVPFTSYENRPGRWIAVKDWPSPSVEQQRRPLGKLLIGEPGDEPESESLWVQSPLSVGLFAGKWCSYSGAPDLPHDQREEDGGALLFETNPLEETVEICGAPVAELEISVDRPVAMLAARLSDVRPDGKVTRVTYGLLNLTHRNSHEKPELLEPGKHYNVRVDLNDIAQTFPAGHAVRLSVSTSYWPIAWPAPQPVKLTIHTRNSFLTLPVRETRPESDRAVSFEPPEKGPCGAEAMLRAGEQAWRVVRELGTDEAMLEVIKDDGTMRIEDIGTEVDQRTVERYTSVADDFCSIQGETWTSRTFRRGKWKACAETRTILSCTPTHFRIEADIDAYEGENRIFCKTWSREIPRDHV